MKKIREMDLYEEIPSTLISSFGKEISPPVSMQLNFLWKGMHETALRSLDLSHQMSRSFVQLVKEHGINNLPEFVMTERICQWCCVIQLPSVTCQSRLRKRSLKGGINRYRKGAGESAEGESHPSAKLKNVLVSSCLLCKHKAKPITEKKKMHGREESAKNDVSGVRRDSNTSTNNMSNGMKKITSTNSLDSKSKSKDKKSKNSFSFKNGGAITASAISASCAAGINAFIGVNNPTTTLKSSSPQGDFFSFAANRKKGVSDCSANNANKVMSLDDMQRANKKKKRKLK